MRGRTTFFITIPKRYAEALVRMLSGYRNGYARRIGQEWVKDRVPSYLAVISMTYYDDDYSEELHEDIDEFAKFLVSRYESMMEEWTRTVGRLTPVWELLRGRRLDLGDKRWVCVVSGRLVHDDSEA